MGDIRMPINLLFWTFLCRSHFWENLDSHIVKIFLKISGMICAIYTIFDTDINKMMLYYKFNFEGIVYLKFYLNG